MTVRLATRPDEPAIYDLLLQLYDENAMAMIASDKVQRMIKAGTRGNGGVIGVIDGSHGMEASLGMKIGQWWYSDEWHLEEMWLHVHPAHRHTDHAQKLIDFAKDCADRLGLPLLMGILTHSRADAKVRLYRRQIPQVGALFLHRVGSA